MTVEVRDTRDKRDSWGPPLLRPCVVDRRGTGLEKEPSEGRAERDEREGRIVPLTPTTPTLPTVPPVRDPRPSPRR